MKRTNLRRVWRVEGSKPPNEGRNWAANVNLQVIADTLEEAATAARERHPDITLIKVMADRYVEDVIVVPAREPDHV